MEEESKRKQMKKAVKKLMKASARGKKSKIEKYTQQLLTLEIANTKK